MTAYSTTWQPWFAWHPVRLQIGGWRWLCRVDRLFLFAPFHSDGGGYYVYRGRRR